MTDRTTTCPDGDRLVELALGQLTGRDRADALEHLLGCRACRDEVDEIMATADQLLLAAPEAEPPIGFESDVLARIAPPRRARWRRPMLVAAAIASAAALVVAALVVVTATRADDEPGQLARAEMVAAEGYEVGAAWRYAGNPGWVLVSVPGWAVWEDPSGSPHDYWLQAVLDDGSEVSLGTVAFGGDDGSWGTTTDLDVDRIRTVAIVDETGRVWCEATF